MQITKQDFKSLMLIMACNPSVPQLNRSALVFRCEGNRRMATVEISSKDGKLFTVKIPNYQHGQQLLKDVPFDKVGEFVFKWIGRSRYSAFKVGGCL